MTSRFARIPAHALVRRLALAASLSLAGTSAASAGTLFEAEDSAAGYPAGTDWVGQNGGSGFAAWTSEGDEPAARRIDEGFYLQAADTGTGAIVMKRALDTDAPLQEGTFSATSWGWGDEAGDFVGFALYGQDGELFRWGLGVSGGEPVFRYSTDGGARYETAFSGYPSSSRADYSLSWSLLDGALSLVLREATYFPDGCDIRLTNSSAVTAFAALLEEGGIASAHGDGTEMLFDNLSVRGVTASIPEPSSSACLATGLVALLCLLRRRPLRR